MSQEWLLAGLLFVAAVLDTAVGHGGASGYLAVMAVVGLEPTVMKPTTLVLNILVATIATVRYARVGRSPGGRSGRSYSARCRWHSSAMLSISPARSINPSSRSSSSSRGCACCGRRRGN